MSELRQLRALEEENHALKQVVTDLTLDKQLMSEARRRKSDADTTAWYRGTFRTPPFSPPARLEAGVLLRRL